MIIKKEIINIGLIGAGSWGINYIKTINYLPNIHLKLVYTTNNSVKKIIKSNCKITSDITPFFNSHELDGIIIATPPSIQIELAIKFIKVGMPLLLEKPLCTSIKDADLILKLSCKFRSLILVNNIFLYSEAYKVFKNILKNENNLTHFYALDGNKGPYRKYMNSFWDWGPHSLSLCLSIMGKPLSGKLEEVSYDGRGKNYKIEFEFKKGRTGTLIFGNAMNEKTRCFQVELGDKNSVLTFNDLATKKVYKKEKTNQFKYYDYKVQEPLVSVINQFSKKILRNEYNSQSIQLNRDIVYILQMLFLNKYVKFELN